MAFNYNFSHVTPQIEDLAGLCVANNNIDPALYAEYDVKRGLRDINGKGVLTGLTEISEIISSKAVNGETVQCDGELYYRGININDLVNGFVKDNRFGFEEATYLLLFGQLPTKEELSDFNKLISDFRTLPTTFVRDVMMKSPSKDIMNNLARGVLTLYAYDDAPNDISIPNVLRQSVELIALFPLLAVYGYQAKSYYLDKESLFIHQPKPELSTAENILHLLRPDSEYTELEAKILDLALVLHAEHGGGNIKVVNMFEDIMANVSDWTDDEMISDYLVKLLHKEAFDRSGLIYGMGHAVYSISDPRAKIFKQFVEKLSIEKHMEKEYALYSLQRICLQHAQSPDRALYPAFRYRKNFRLVSSPH